MIAVERDRTAEIKNDLLERAVWPVLFPFKNHYIMANPSCWALSQVQWSNSVIWWDREIWSDSGTSKTECSTSSVFRPRSRSEVKEPHKSCWRSNPKGNRVKGEKSCLWQTRVRKTIIVAVGSPLDLVVPPPIVELLDFYARTQKFPQLISTDFLHPNTFF